MKQVKDDTLRALAQTEEKLETKINGKVDIFSEQLKSITNMIYKTKAENESQSNSIERMESNQSRLIVALEALIPKAKPQKPPIRAVEQGSCHGVVK